LIASVRRIGNRSPTPQVAVGAMADRVVRPEIDRLATECGWYLLSSTDNVPAVVYDDGYVVAAVGWSAWDGVAVKALATHLAHLPGPSVAVFNIDDSLPSITASRLPGVDLQPWTVPVIVRYVDGSLVRTEQGKNAVDWMQELAQS
jgi:hypothetical protein